VSLFVWDPITKQTLNLNESPDLWERRVVLLAPPPPNRNIPLDYYLLIQTYIVAHPPTHPPYLFSSSTLLLSIDLLGGQPA
jgi:hypothetical protein